MTPPLTAPPARTAIRWLHAEGLPVPSTVYVQFDIRSPIRATPRRLHAAFGRILDLPEGIDPARAAGFPALAHRPPHDLSAPKPYSLGEMVQSESVFGVELRFLDDRLLDTLDAWLAWGGVLPVGDGGPGTSLAVAEQAQVLQCATWEELAASDAATAWSIRIVTPTVFTSRGAHTRQITPAALATSLHARWRRWSPSTCPWLPERERLDTVLTTRDDTRCESVSLGMPRRDGRGRLSDRRIMARTGELRVSGATGSATTAVFSRLMALARYANVGSHAAFGMGVIDVVPDDGA